MSLGLAGMAGDFIVQQTKFVLSNTSSKQVLFYDPTRFAVGFSIAASTVTVNLFLTGSFLDPIFQEINTTTPNIWFNFRDHGNLVMQQMWSSSNAAAGSVTVCEVLYRPLGSGGGYNDDSLSSTGGDVSEKLSLAVDSLQQSAQALARLLDRIRNGVGLL